MLIVFPFHDIPSFDSVSVLISRSCKNTGVGAPESNVQSKSSCAFGAKGRATDIFGRWSLCVCVRVIVFDMSIREIDLYELVGELTRPVKD